MNFAAILSAITTYAPMVVSAASAASAVLPQGTSGSFWSGVRSVIDVLALNFGNAKNAKNK